jgi:outer membrane protein assembly factor BamB
MVENSASMVKADPDRKHRPVRLWPAIVIGILATVAVVWIQTGDSTGQNKYTRSVMILFATLVLLVLWWTFFSRIRARVRVTGLVVVLVLVVAGTQLIRIKGVTGDLEPLLKWRWATTPDEALPRGDLVSPGPGVGPEPPAGAADYPQFLGPNRNGTLQGLRLARDWDAHPPREVWRREVGAGWSSFAVTGGIAVTQEQRGPDEMVVAYDLATGEILWTHSDPVRYETTIAGIGPRATPTVADGRVYTLGATGILNALDLVTGEPLWSRDIVADNATGSPQWGRSCSPLVLDDVVVVSAGGSPGRSLVAYDRETGERAWSDGDDFSGYSSPYPTTLAGVPQILIFNRGSVVAHDPGSGQVLWTFPWPAEQPNVAQPLPLPGDRLLVSSGYGIGSKLLRVVSRADEGGKPALDTELIWESPRLKAKFTNPVFHDGYIYSLDDGTMVCLDPETGERRWKRGRYGHGQVLLVEELLIATTEKGEVVLLEPDPDAHVELGRVKAVDGRLWNTPALAGRYLLVRNDREAVCYELPTEG